MTCRFPPAHTPELDGIRAAAILLVIGLHTFGNAVPLGWAGVILFFVLSGFLITGILLDAKAAHTSGGRFFLVFYARRSIRIFPIYILSVVFVLFLSIHMGWAHANFLWYFAYLQNFKINWLAGAPTAAFPGFMDHTWSLAVEEQFYFIWPWFVFGLSRRALGVTSVALIVGAPVFRWVLHTRYPSDVYFYTLLPSQVAALGAGALLAILGRAVPLPTLRRAGQWYALAAVVGLPILFPERIFAAVWRAGLLRYIGRISYGLYLYHPIVFHMTWATLRRHLGVRAALGSTGETLLSLVLSFTVAAVSWHLFEAPINSLKSRLLLTGRVAPPAGTITDAPGLVRP